MSVRIAVDAMGGDHGPGIVVKGAVEAAKEDGLEILLVGREPEIKDWLGKQGHTPSNMQVVHASEVIEMHEPPAAACRQKRQSSIMVANALVKEGRADAVVTPGHTGAAVAAALFTGGRLKGVARPAIAALWPATNGHAVLLDIGANVDCKPKHLVQFAIMGHVYAELMLRNVAPRVALLSIGEEDTKGNELVLQTAELLRKTPLRFIGNVEGRDLIGDKADVIVCDGFVGNVTLKFGESLAKKMYEGIKNEFVGRTIFRHIGALLVWPVLTDFMKKADNVERGGAPLLGVRAPCIIGHGRSNARAVRNAILTAKQFVEKGVNARIEERLQELHATFKGEGGGLE